MFIMPIPPTRSDMNATHMSRFATLSVCFLSMSANSARERMRKSSSASPSLWVSRKTSRTFSMVSAMSSGWATDIIMLSMLENLTGGMVLYSCG